jgi:hypothetical protein
MSDCIDRMLEDMDRTAEYKRAEVEMRIQQDETGESRMIRQPSPTGEGKEEPPPPDGLAWRFLGHCPECGASAAVCRCGGAKRELERRKDLARHEAEKAELRTENECLSASCKAAAEQYDALRLRVEELERDAKRYRRLRVVGVAPYNTPELERGFVLRFTNLDEFMDAEFLAHPSRGEAGA